jgi:GDP-D-mannose dehydratase
VLARLAVTPTQYRRVTYLTLASLTLIVLIEAGRDWGYAKDYVEAMWLML